MTVDIFPKTEEKPVETKKITQSKTFWLNALMVAAGTATFLVGHEVVAQYPVVVSILTVVAGGLNVALRYMTDKPIG